MSEYPCDKGHDQFSPKACGECLSERDAEVKGLEAQNDRLREALEVCWNELQHDMEFCNDSGVHVEEALSESPAASLDAVRAEVWEEAARYAKDATLGNSSCALDACMVEEDFNKKARALRESGKEEKQMACSDKRTIMMAFMDLHPALHQAKCGCGFETARSAEMGDVLDDLHLHRGKEK